MRTRVLFVALILLLVLLIWFMQGCQFMKLKHERESRTTSVSKKDSVVSSVGTGGAVAKTDDVTRSEWDWWKTTLINSLASKDTTVVAPAKPQIIIMEGGRGNMERQVNTFDSSWFKDELGIIYRTIDTLALLAKENSKQKEGETKGLGLFAVLLIALGVPVVFKIIEKVFGGYKVIKKDQ